MLYVILVSMLANLFVFFLLLLSLHACVSRFLNILAVFFIAGLSNLVLGLNSATCSPNSRFRHFALKIDFIIIIIIIITCMVAPRPP